MGYRCWGERFLTANFSGTPVHSQRLEMANDTVLKAVRSRFVIYNNPTFTLLSMKIYSDVDGNPGQLLYTSSKTWIKSEITSYDHGAIEIYFDFDSEPPLAAGMVYHLVPWLTGYTGDGTSHVAWVKAFPDPYYDTGLTVEHVELATLPYVVGLIGADL